MALKRATGGGDYLDLKELARDNTLVVFRILEFQADEQMVSSVVQPVMTDVLIASGPRQGEVHLGERQINKGVTGTLRRGNELGDEVAARLELRKTGGVEWVAAQDTSDPEYAHIESLFAKGDPWANVQVPAQAGTANGAPAERPF